MVLNSSGPGGISSSSSGKERVSVPVQVGTLTYTGSEQSPSWSEYDSSIIEISGVTFGTDAGNYDVQFTILEPKEYIWEDGSKGNKIVQWSIGKAIVESTPYQTGTLTYNGGEQTPVWTSYNNIALEISGETSGTDAGTYTVSFTPKLNYKWSDGTTNAKTVTWTIQKAKIAETPSQSGTLTYNGEEQSPQWSNYDEDKMSLTGTTVGTNAGDYTVTFTPNSNYTWENNSSAGIDIAWTINKALANLTVSDTNVTLDAENTSKVVTVSYTGDGEITVTNSDSSIVNASLSGNQLTISSIDDATSGQATITVTCLTTNNYTGGSQTINVSCEFAILYTVTINSDETMGTITGAGIYEEGTEVTISATSEDGYEFSNWKKSGEISRLPNGYRELEYIESDSNCSIDTGFAGNFLTTRVVLDIKCGTYITSNEQIIGTVTSAEPYFRVFRLSATKTRYRFLNYGAVTLSIDITNERLNFDFDFPNEKFIIGENEYSISASSTSMESSILLFGFGGKSTVAKLYSCKIYDNFSLVRDYVPCISPNNNIGLYDLISNTFYENTGTGNFTAGPEIGGEQIIEENPYTFTINSNVTFEAVFKQKELKWSSSTVAVSGLQNSVACDGEVFIIIPYYTYSTTAENKIYLMSKYNGKSWVTKSSGPQDVYKVIWAGDKFICGPYGSSSTVFNTLYYSTFGSSWKTTSLPSSRHWHAIGYGKFSNGKKMYVLLTRWTYSNKSWVAYSEDGLTWEEKELSNVTYYDSVEFGNDRFVSLAYTTTSSTAICSTDGINWTTHTTPVAGTYNAFCFGAGLFVGILYNSDTVITSPDGITWTKRTMPKSANYMRLCYGGGRFVATIWGDTEYATSKDGINWEIKNFASATEKKWNNIAYGKTYEGPSQFVVTQGNVSNASAYIAYGE